MQTFEATPAQVGYIMMILGPSVASERAGQIGVLDEAFVAPDDLAGQVQAALDSYSKEAALKLSLRKRAAWARYAKETGGILVGNIKIATDEASQAKITGAYVKASRDGTFTTHWKGADGTFIMLDAATMLAVGDAVAAHVSACFSKEAAVNSDIDSGKIKDISEVDAAFALASAS